ncbi:MAG: hypothetical protein LBD14_05185 [Puniceicoccales bacterium]|jgi:hypothetical protein|nr:hypothetical protein [Puniceicoccales bacterium]
MRRSIIFFVCGLLSSSATVLFCGGCMFVAVFADDDMSGVEATSARMQSERMERFGRNPSMNEAELRAVEARTGGRSQVPLRPSIEELERHVAEERAALEKTGNSGRR